MAYEAFGVGEFPGAFTNRSYGRALDRFAKRLFDLAVSIVLLTCTSLLFIVVFLANRLDGGPCLFRHDRIGIDGRTFKCLKFRTMVTDGEAVLARHFVDNPFAQIEWTETLKLRNDPRVTRIGAFLRKTSLDEVPQLLNVLLGDMSLVGPRPITAGEAYRYGPVLELYMSVLPGITGLWQVSGRSSTTYERRVQLDAEYVASWSLRKDMAILMRTVPAVLSRDGAC